MCTSPEDSCPATPVFPEQVGLDSAHASNPFALPSFQCANGACLAFILRRLPALPSQVRRNVVGQFGSEGDTVAKLAGSDVAPLPRTYPRRPAAAEYAIALGASGAVNNAEPIGLVLRLARGIHRKRDRLDSVVRACSAD